nr:hypothetical protein [Tanacetum cinerariifolium]
APTPTFLNVNHYLSKAEGVASLSQWCERIESVFHISNCAAENQVKFATCTLHSVALTWMFSKEANKIEKYVGGLPDMIHGNNTGRVYTTASGAKKQYGGSRPLCAKCNYHHDDPCAPKCHNCNKIGHSTSDCRSVAITNNANNQRATGSGQKLGCYECGVQGHFRRECPKLKNSNNHGNQGGRNNAPARVYAVGRAGTDLDANIVTGTFLLNN